MPKAHAGKKVVFFSGKPFVAELTLRSGQVVTTVAEGSEFSVPGAGTVPFYFVAFAPGQVKTLERVSLAGSAEDEGQQDELLE